MNSAHVYVTGYTRTGTYSTDPIERNGRTDAQLIAWGKRQIAQMRPLGRVQEYAVRAY